MEEVRQFAPQAFRTQRRGVTEQDWADLAGEHEGVQKASARFRWTGSWYTVFVTLDRKGGLSVADDPEFEEEIRTYLEQFRVAGYDLEIDDPVPVALDVALTICVQSGYFQSDVKQSLLDQFSSSGLGGGRRGFFHPDEFSFGDSVYLSRVYKVAMEVAGVASVDATIFKRLGKAADGELEAGVIQPAALEVVELANNPSFPERGQIVFQMYGGS